MAVLIICLKIPFSICAPNFKNLDLKLKTEKYEDLYDSFETDYDIENPLTKKAGLKRKYEK